MRGVIAILLLLSIAGGIWAACLPKEKVAAMEEELHYSMGLAGERRLFSFSVEDKAEGGSICPILPAEEVEEKDSIVTFRGEDRTKALAERVAEKLLTEEVIDYALFAFGSEPIPLTSPLEWEELCFVFSEILRSETLPVPIRGDVEEITIVTKEESLRVSARVILSFSGIAEGYGLTWIPESATFFGSMTFRVKESEIFVDYTKLTIKCESFDLPEALLIFACNAIFGKKDYKTLFGETVKKVFVNAGIYS